MLIAYTGRKSCLELDVDQFPDGAQRSVEGALRLPQNSAVVVSLDEATVLAQRKDIALFEPFPEPVRAREPDGRYKADDPTTKQVDEAWKDGKAPVKKSVRKSAKAHKGKTK